MTITIQWCDGSTSKVENVAGIEWISRFTWKIRTFGNDWQVNRDVKKIVAFIDE